MPRVQRDRIPGEGTLPRECRSVPGLITTWTFVSGRTNRGVEWAVSIFKRDPKRARDLPEVRPPGSVWWWIIPGALLLGGAAWATTRWLLTDLDQLVIKDQVSARIEAARTALAAAAGVGAAWTLVLALRRQRHQELSTAHTTHDAWFSGATFTGDAQFNEATGRGLGTAVLEGVQVRVDPASENLVRIWPAAWRVEPGEGGWQTLRLASELDDVPDGGEAADRPKLRLRRRTARPR